MSRDGPGQLAILPVPAITALMQDAGVAQEPRGIAMERSFSEDIQEGTQELKEAAEQTKNIILDLSLDGIVRWVSPSWTDVVGTDLEQVKGQPISKFISDNPLVFEPAIQALKSNASKSQFVKFAVTVAAPLDINELMAEGDEAESHTMWMLQPATDPLRIEISLPQTLVDSLGVGAEILANHLTDLAETGSNDSDNHPPPSTILCRVCERYVVPWWFEKHSDLCVQEHKAEMDVQMVQESLAEHRHAIVKILDAFEARQGRQKAGESVPGTQPEYKGQPIGSASTASSSGQTSKATSPYRSRSPSIAGLAPTRPRSFIVRRPLVRIVELILDLCDTALEISTPSIKEGKISDDDDTDDDFQTQSPSSESRISQVLGWQQPSSLDNEPALMALASDTEKFARAKVEMVYRHQSILEYSERIRQECMAEVDACISEALLKAERAHAGEDLSSSESEGEEKESAANQLSQAASSPSFFPESLSDEPTPIALPHDAEPTSYVGIKSMAQALRNPNDMQPLARLGQSRASSQAVSTGSSSPAECPTPKSRRGTQLSQAQPIPNHRSRYVDDVNDSDGSLPSSSLASSHIRAESPASQSDLGISRTRSSRERNRRSMHLHTLGSNSPQRQQSPSRYPPPPPSPLRLSKARIPSTERSTSPIVSPLLTAGEFVPQNAPVHHHRRQSSMHSSDLRAPISPHLSSIPRPQERAMPPSIKDFEIIKPISRGAFGSVYLAKKKRTGEYFAIKVLRKSDMIAKNQVTNVKAERAIMMWQGESNFVAKLYYTFSSKDCLFLVMEYLNGGDCAALVKILGGLTEDWAKKYIAEVVLGVQHLHTRGIVHRDLKPDNLLIDSKGHLKLTDFGLSRMGLVGRQKRALKQPDDVVPDLLKNGPFPQSDSNPATRSASFDFHGQSSSPAQTPLMTPALSGGLDPPSYFSLNAERSLSRGLSRRPSGYRSDSGSVSSHDLHHAFKSLALHDNESHPSSAHSRSGLIEEEGGSIGSDSPDLLPLSQSMSNITVPPAPASHEMLPPPTALFDPGESDKRFVGTPDYLAPETINGKGQDEMCDWWSVGCIMFEFLFGYPPFNANTPDQVFDNILNRRIAWPEDDEAEVSDEAKDLINKLIQLEPNERLGANKDDKFENGGQEIQAHPWFADINWHTLLEDEAQFVPHPEHPEDTEYFDSRGATLSSFPEELEDQMSPPALPNGDYGDRLHDTLFRARLQGNTKRGLMPLHIPPHVAGDSRSRRLSEPVIADDFGNFTYKNLPVLEKANKDIVERMRKDAMQAQSRVYASQSASASNTPAVGSPAPSLDGSPMVPMPVKRALSISKGHRPQSPSGLGPLNSSPSRPLQPSSPLLVQFSTSQHHERRKTSGSSLSSGSLQPGGFFDISADLKGPSAASSPIKQMRVSAAASPAAKATVPARTSSVHGRARSQTVGSQDGEPPTLREAFIPSHHKRRSQLFARDVSPSSSDNETAQQKALLKVQRRRQSSRRLSQFNLLEGPSYRPLDILIVEDHPVSKMVMEKLFEKLKCRTITASNGPEALRLAVSPIPFDIIFMEFKLPIINGIDIARMIRDTKSANSTTPIVCVTGYLKDLLETHHFDTLMQKPPTIPKLTEELCKFCQWKPPPRDLKPSEGLDIPTTAARTDQIPTQDSPSSVTSSLAPTMPDFSWKSSSREDSIGSGGFFGDLDSLKADEIPLIISRAATDEWSNRGGLGISDETLTAQRPHGQSHPQLLHSESAPATAEEKETLSATDIRTPIRKRSSEAIQSKREQMAKSRIDTTGPEEGDDEDEELGHAQIQQRSPVGKSARQASKLGIEMMRTNSRGSVISMHDDRAAEPESLRKSLELLEERMEGMKIIEEVDPATLAVTQPLKTDRTVSSHSHPDTGGRPSSFGHITPPEIFPRNPGHLVVDFVETETVPLPTKTTETELERTPQPQDPSSGSVAYFAFVYLQRQRELLKQYGVELEFHPVFLGGINVGSGNKPPWTLPAKAKFGKYDVARGIEYFQIPPSSPPPFFPILSILPLRALLVIKARHDTATFERCFQAAFEYSWNDGKHLDISKPENLAVALRGVLGDDKEVEEVVRLAATSQEVKDQLKANTERALAQGAFGAPWFWLRNADTGKEEPLWGSDRWAYMWQFLGVEFDDLRIRDKREGERQTKL
ncbi:hypothetical protein DV736_g3546, partial [Chaetothyriales sp. CBS 134916]